MGVSMGVGLSVALGMGMAMGAPSSGTEVRISHRISHENEGEEHARGALEERGSNAMEVGVGKRGLGDLPAIGTCFSNLLRDILRDGTSAMHFGKSASSPSALKYRAQRAPGSKLWKLAQSTRLCNAARSLYH